MNNILKTFALVLVLFAPTSYAVNSVYFDPDPTSFDLSAGTGTLDLWMDFDDTTVGGSLDLAFGGSVSVLDFFESSEWGTTFDTSGFSGHGGSASGADNDYLIFFGNIAEFSGIRKIGTVLFSLDSEGLGSIGLTHNSLQGPFATLIGGVLPVDLIDRELNVVSAVPVPAAIWFMVSGMISLTAFGRRKSVA